MTRLLLVLAAALTGLMAGLYASFACAVMPGLRRADDHTYVRAMQHINAAILNPVFGLMFGGALVVAIAALVASRNDSQVWPWAAAGLALYAVTLVITMAANVPLNDQLKANEGDVAALREAFDAGWVRWNLVRTGAAVGSFAALLLGLSRTRS